MSLNKKKPKESLEEVKRGQWKKNQVKAVATRLSTDHHDSEIKPDPTSQTFMTRVVEVDDEKSEI